MLNHIEELIEVSAGKNSSFSLVEQHLRHSSQDFGKPFVDSDWSANRISYMVYVHKAVIILILPDQNLKDLTANDLFQRLELSPLKRLKVVVFILGGWLFLVLQQQRHRYNVAPAEV